MPFTTQQLLDDFTKQLSASYRQLLDAVNAGNRTTAHQKVDAIVDLQREIEDITQKAIPR